MLRDQLLDEAGSFDNRVTERVKNGLIPDLQNAAHVDWFFNNPWRRPQYVDMIFGDYLRFAIRHISGPSIKILEIGSGLGHMSLELARAGHDVTGLELSLQSVKIATDYYSKCEKSDSTGRLKYVNADLMQWNSHEKFDMICFFLTLHHFAQPVEVIEKVIRLLNPGGKIVVIEPARDMFSERNAAVVALIRVLLSLNGHWYEEIPLPENQQTFKSLTDEVLNEYRDAKDKNEQEQSPNDNSSFSATMLEALNRYFLQLDLTFGNTISPRLLGGVRGKNELETLHIASFIKSFDEFATSHNIIEPGVFYYAGKLK